MIYCWPPKHTEVSRPKRDNSADPPLNQQMKQ